MHSRTGFYLKGSVSARNAFYAPSVEIFVENACGGRCAPERRSANKHSSEYIIIHSKSGTIADIYIYIYIYMIS